MRKRILVIFLGMGIILGVGFYNHFVWADTYYNPLENKRYILPVSVIDKSREKGPGEEKIEDKKEMSKEIDNPSKEAKNFALLIKRIFSQTPLAEIILIKIEEGESIINYLVKTRRIVDAEGKPLNLQEATQVLKYNPQLWQVALLKLYYEVNRIKIDKTFENFVSSLQVQKELSPEVAFLAVLMGKGKGEFLEKFFRELPPEETVRIEPMVKSNEPEKINKIMVENIGAAIGKKMSEVSFYKDNFKQKKIFLQIDMGKGMKFLGLLVSTIGTVLISPQGVVSYLNFPQE